jgi:small membrane protein
VIVAFKLFLIGALAMTVRVYLQRGRTILRDRLIILALFAGLLPAIVYPPLTTTVARWLGIGRGSDLAMYVAFVLVFFLLAILSARHQEMQRAVTCLTREVALLRARQLEPESSGTEDQRS